MNSTKTVGKVALGLRRFHSFSRAACVLLDYLNPDHVAPKPVRKITQNGYAYDFYEPHKPIGKDIVIVYGFTIAGEKEIRLVRFAQSFAKFGFRVTVPVLPGLKSINIESGDFHILVDVLKDLLTASSPPVGIVGFSVGGGLALVTATDPSLQGCIDPVILMGSPYSFVEIWENLWRRDFQSPQTNQEWSDFIWRQLLMAYRDHKTLGLSSAELDEITHLLQIFCHENSLAKKRDVYERVLKPHGYLDPRCVPVDEHELKRFSPAGKMQAITSRVFIIQDPHDMLVPFTQAEKIMAELEQRNVPYRQRLLMSSMFSHVRVRDMLNISDLIATLEIFGELYS